MNKWQFLRGAAVAATAIVEVSTAAHAQQASSGPVTELSFTLEDRYDSNIARTDRARAAARGLTLGDARATPGVQLTVARPLGRNTLALTASAGYDFYRRNSRLNRERLSLVGDADIAAGPCQIGLTPSFSRRQSDLSDLAIIAVPGVDAVKNTETVQDYAAELRCGNRYGLRPLVTIDRAIGDNSAPLRRISDYRSWRYGAGLSYDSPALGEFTFLASRTENRYPHRPAALGRSAYTSNRAELTLQRALGAILTATGGISYISLDPSQGSVERFRGLGWNLALTAVPTPDLRLNAGLSRDVAPSLGTDALYLVNRRYSLGVDYAFSRRMSVGLTASSSQQRYVGATPIFGPLLTRSNLRSVVGTVSASTTRRLSVSADLGYLDRNANGTIYDYRSFFAALRTKFTL